jgi:hypothetical protein
MPERPHTTRDREKENMTHRAAQPTWTMAGSPYRSSRTRDGKLMLGHGQCLGESVLLTTTGMLLGQMVMLPRSGNAHDKPWHLFEPNFNPFLKGKSVPVLQHGYTTCSTCIL